jgi:hypothetical protein
MAEVAIDPFAAAVARTDLEEASAGREAAATTDVGMTDFELVRRLWYILSMAAQKVGVPYNDYGYDYEGLAEAIVRVAQGNAKLSPSEYRSVYRIWSIFRRNPLPVRNEAAAS